MQMAAIISFSIYLYNLASVHCSCIRVWLLPFLNCLFWLKPNESWGQLRPFVTNFAFLACWFRLTVCLFLLTVMTECCRAECTLYRVYVHYSTFIEPQRQTRRSPLQGRQRGRGRQSKTARLGRLGDWQVESRWLSTDAPDAQSERNWAVVSLWPSVAILLTLHSWVPPSSYCFVCFALSLSSVWSVAQTRNHWPWVPWGELKGSPRRPRFASTLSLINLHNAVTHTPRAPNTLLYFLYLLMHSLYRSLHFLYYLQWL